jgi:hypothetical protein
LGKNSLENLKLSLAYDEQAGLIDIFEAGSVSVIGALV